MSGQNLANWPFQTLSRVDNAIERLSVLRVAGFRKFFPDMLRTTGSAVSQTFQTGSGLGRCGKGGGRVSGVLRSERRFQSTSQTEDCSL